jgi:CheY-like chemotaxis protein
MELKETLREARFLVIEDDPDHQKIAEMTLQSAGCSDITFFSTGEEAIEFFESGRPSGEGCEAVILIDLMLPNISGFEILRHLGSNENWKACKKVVLSCSTSVEDQSRSRECGADAFFSKPFRREYLEEIISSLP